MRSDLLTLLDQLEPNTLPSRRYNRLVEVGSGLALELRDPNSGLSSDPASTPRHQYLRAGGVLWTRRLPPETVGDCWEGDSEPPPWTRIERLPGHSLLRQAMPLLPELKIAALRRERFYRDGELEHCIQGKYVDSSEVDDHTIPMGPMTDAWSDVPLPPCPDCGGTVVWYEAGYVPGTRRCTQCGSMFSVFTP